MFDQVRLRSTMHPQFEATGLRTYDIHSDIMTVG